MSAPYVTFSNLEIGTLTVPTVQLTSEVPEGNEPHTLTFRCFTATYADYAALAALYGATTASRTDNGKTWVTSKGTGATLTANGIENANCYIIDLSAAEPNNSLPFDCWEFTIKFVQHTAASS